MNRGLPKSSRLYLRNDIRTLYEKGSSFTVKPVRCSFRVMSAKSGSEVGCKSDSESGTTEGKVKLMVSAPKRYLRRAVNRNYMKRRLRESFRLNRDILKLSEDECLHLALIYNRGELMEYKAVEELVIRVLDELNRRLESLRCK